MCFKNAIKLAQVYHQKLHKCIIRHAFWKYLFCANDILNIGVMTHADTQPVLVALDLHFLFRYKVLLVTD